MFLSLAPKVKPEEGRRQEGEPVPLTKCIEFRLNYFREYLDGFGDALRRTFALLVGFRAHGTWQYFEVFRILHEAVSKFGMLHFFFLCSLCGELCGGGNDDRGPMYRFANKTVGIHFTNFLLFKKLTT